MNRFERCTDPAIWSEHEWLCHEAGVDALYRRLHSEPAYLVSTVPGAPDATTIAVLRAQDHAAAMAELEALCNPKPLPRPRRNVLYGITHRLDGSLIFDGQEETFCLQQQHQ